MSGGSSGLGSKGSIYNALDPGNFFGKSSSSVFGNIVDPGNIFGMNPQASNNPRLTSMNGDGSTSVPTTLPNLGGQAMQPHYYDPNSFQPRQLTGGMFNQMAQQGAGQQYVPKLMQPQASNQMGAQGAVPGNPYTLPPVMPMTPFGQQVRANMNGTEPMPQVGPGMMRGIKAQFGGFPAAHSIMPYSPYNGPIY
jgi:hypothetical protein